MSVLTKNELNAIKKVLHNEMIIIKRYKLFLAETRETEFKDIYNRAVNVHEKHFNTIASYLK